MSMQPDGKILALAAIVNGVGDSVFPGAARTLALFSTVTEVSVSVPEPETIEVEDRLLHVLAAKAPLRFANGALADGAARPSHDHDHV